MVHFSVQISKYRFHNQSERCSNLEICTEIVYQKKREIVKGRPEHFARPTSGTIHFYHRTCPFYLEQVPLTCKAISQLLLTSGQSMTYQFVSMLIMFRKESIPFIRSTFGEINLQCKNENYFYGHFFPVKVGRDLTFT